VVDILGLGMSLIDLLQVVEDFPAGPGVTEACESHLMGGGPVPTALCAAAKLGTKAAIIQIFYHTLTHAHSDTHTHVNLVFVFIFFCIIMARWQYKVVWFKKNNKKSHTAHGLYNVKENI